MPSLSIKNVPELVVERLRLRAAANHRSLQGELMVIINRAAADSVAHDQDGGLSVQSVEGKKSVKQLTQEMFARYPEPITQGPRSVDIIRADRDSR